MLLERFRKLGPACLELAQEPRVLDRHRRLGGEAFEDADLLPGKGAHLEPPYADRAYRLAVAQQRHGESGAKTHAGRHCVAGEVLVRLLEDVTDMDRLAVDEGPSHHPVATDRESREVDRDRPVVGTRCKLIAVLQEYGRIMGIADLRRALGDGSEDRLDVRNGAHAEPVPGEGVRGNLHVLIRTCRQTRPSGHPEQDHSAPGGRNPVQRRKALPQRLCNVSHADGRSLPLPDSVLVMATICPRMASLATDTRAGSARVPHKSGPTANSASNAGRALASWVQSREDGDPNRKATWARTAHVGCGSIPPGASPSPRAPRA